MTDESISEIFWNYLQSCAFANNIPVKHVTITGTGWSLKDYPKRRKGIIIEWIE